ncbi:MAG: universal stress protein [Saprospiraceae bacterium]|nr:universal stress protein [Saprospiraceae bacterium]
MEKILLATDFSDACENALKYTLALVENTDIKVDFLNVYDIPVVVSSSMPSRAIDGIMKEKANAVESHLRELHESIPVNHRGIFRAIYGPYAATEISEFAKDEGHDMIVMGMKQNYGLMDRMMGTVTAQTIQLATVPVLAIPNQSLFHTYNQILFPTANPTGKDLAEAEKKAIDWLLKFSQLFGKPKIHMLHVEKNSDQTLTDITSKAEVNDQFDFTKSYAETIEDGIISYYEKEHAELLAFYKPYRYFWERLYHSSLIRKILFKTRVPILIFR